VSSLGRAFGVDEPLQASWFQTSDLCRVEAV
jgi:hypothetical protein